VTGIAQYRFPESFRRHYERLAAFPEGALVLGDAMARINPIYGQGMTVAAQEAAELRQLLDSRAGSSTPLQDLAGLFFRRMASILETPWRMSAISDLSFPFVRGERPPNFNSMVVTAAAIEKLAAEDPEVHKLQVEVAHLIKPSNQYFEGPLGERILRHIQQSQQQAGLA
jgi:2-polyprenyl-6-methoxyphenol hydroxylase-like FAD-dependent oxidoreductase